MTGEREEQCKTGINGGPGNSNRFLLKLTWSLSHASCRLRNKWKQLGKEQEDWTVEDLNAWGRRRWKQTQRQERAGNQVPDLRGISNVSSGLQETNKKSVRKMTHLRTKGQFIIRLRNKREVNQGNMLEKWWLWSHWGRLRDILAVIPMTRMNDYVKCFQIGEIYYFGKDSSRKDKGKIPAWFVK